jgi:hypothetical protein
MPSEMWRQLLEEVERHRSAVQDVWHVAPRQQQLIWADVPEPLKSAAGHFGDCPQRGGVRGR